MKLSVGRACRAFCGRGQVSSILLAAILSHPLFAMAQDTPFDRSKTVLPLDALGAASMHYDQHARVLFGVTGGSIYGNDFLDFNTGIEIPFAKRFEFDGGYTFTPLEHHISLGFGTAQKYDAGGIIWVRKNLGINGSFMRSAYSVTQASKAGEDVFGGLVYRRIAWGFPARFGFNYVRQVNNHIACNSWVAGKCVNGTEANYLQGGDFNMAVRLGAIGPTIVRMVADVQVGYVLTQGNPQCDGTFGGPVTCPRTAANGGGASGGLVFEFPRHGYETTPF